MSTLQIHLEVVNSATQEVQTTMEGKNMINQATIKKMNEMRLTAMSEAFQNQLSDDNYQSLTFEERVGLIVDQEWYRRKNNKILRLIKKAGFRYSNACIEDIEYHVDRQLNKEQILHILVRQSRSSGVA